MRTSNTIASRGISLRIDTPGKFVKRSSIRGAIHWLGKSYGPIIPGQCLQTEQFLGGVRMGVQRNFNWLKTVSPTKIRRSTRRSRRLVLLAIASIGIGGLGCSSFSGFSNHIQYNSSWNDFVAGYRNSVWSAKAWNARKHQFCGEKYLHDFSVGFRAGYEDVASGSNGCTPAFPPREYWSWKYQSAEGQAKVAAWFSGYPHGARAAEEDGVGNWTQIQTSTTIQTEYAQHGKMTEQEVGMYPIPQSGQGHSTVPMNGIPMPGVPMPMQGEMPMEGSIMVTPPAGGIDHSSSDRSLSDGGVTNGAPRFTPVPDANANR